LAYNYFAQDEEEVNQPGAQPLQQLGQESPVVKATAQQQGQPGGTVSGSFTNLQSYLEANKPVQFGQKVAGQVESDIAGAEQAQKEAETGFRGDVSRGTIQRDEGLLRGVEEAPEKVDVGAFEKMREARYTGPKSFAESQYYQPAYSQTERASQAATATETEGGRKAYLQSKYGSGAGRYDYTPGQQALDAMLIQQDPQGRRALEAARGRGVQAKERFGTLSSALNQYAGQGAQETAQTRAAARGAIGIDESGQVTAESPISRLQRGVQGRTMQARANEQAEYQAMLQALRNRDISAQQAGRFGLTENTRLFNVIPERYLSPGPEPTEAEVASPEEQARMAALSRLAGIENTRLPYAELAGTYQPGSRVTFNRDRFFEELGAKGAAFAERINRPIFAAGGYTDPEYGLAVTHPYTRGGIEGELSEISRLRPQYEELERFGGGPDVASFRERERQAQALRDEIYRRYGYGNILA